MAEAREPGTPMWGADRHHLRHPIRIRLSGKPCPDRQPPHAVSHEHRRPAAQPFGATHGGFDHGNVGLYAAKHRLQID
jgi:hypothetical protein